MHGASNGITTGSYADRVVRRHLGGFSVSLGSRLTQVTAVMVDSLYFAWCWNPLCGARERYANGS